MKYALSENLCRCTAYRSLKDCASLLGEELGGRLRGSPDRVAALTAAEATPSTSPPFPRA